jgi:hypothetical protein
MAHKNIDLGPYADNWKFWQEQRFFLLNPFLTDESVIWTKIMAIPVRLHALVLKYKNTIVMAKNIQFDRLMQMLRT